MNEKTLVKLSRFDESKQSEVRVLGTRQSNKNSDMNWLEEGGAVRWRGNFRLACFTPKQFTAPFFFYLWPERFS